MVPETGAVLNNQMNGEPKLPSILLVALRWLHWLHAIALCSNSFLICSSSTILYHLCAVDVVASGIDDIIVQTHITRVPGTTPHLPKTPNQKSHFFFNYQQLY
jgi:hypothetical protein